MKNPFSNINWFSTNLSLKILSVGVFLAVTVGLLMPKLEHFLMGMALSWSGILAIQIFGLKELPDVEVDRDPLTQLHLR